MPILNLAIGKSKYTINCEEGEEEKILNLAQKLNRRVNSLSFAMRGADEKTILMLCSLTVEGELEGLKNNQETELKTKLSTQEVDVEAINQGDINSELEDRLISHIENTADYILKLTKRIENL